MTRKEQIEQEAMKRFPHFGSDRIKFIQGAEWADETMIEKAIKYIANHFLAPGMDDEIKEFVKYMKGE